MTLAVNILAYLRDHSEAHPVVGHQSPAVRKVWMFATVGGTVEYQTLSLKETVEFSGPWDFPLVMLGSLLSVETYWLVDLGLYCLKRASPFVLAAANYLKRTETDRE